VIWPWRAPRRHALQLVDRPRARMVGLASALALVAAALAWRRRLPDFPDPPPVSELVRYGLPLLLLVFSALALAMLHRRIVDDTLWRQTGAGGRLGRALRLVAPILALLYLPAAANVSRRSARWQAQLLFARLAQGTIDPRLEVARADLAGPLADLLWAAEPRTEQEEKQLRLQVRALLPERSRFRNVRRLIEIRLGTSAERGLATLGPGWEAEATARFQIIAAGARRPFVRLWQGKDGCESPPTSTSQEWLWLLARLCRPEDEAAAVRWQLAVTRTWLRPGSSWTFQGTAWTPRELPPLGGTTPADRTRLLQQEAGQPDEFDAQVLGRQTARACSDKQFWTVVHVWHPATSGKAASWDGGIALSRRTRACWTDPPGEGLSFGLACQKEGRAQLIVPIVLVARAVSTPARSPLPPEDRRLLNEVFGRSDGKTCHPPSQHLANRPIFLLEAGGDQHVQ
jgi:hypothetical protein